MTLFKDKRTICLFLFSTALLIRLATVFSYTTPIGYDESVYNDLAISMVQKGQYYMPTEYSRPPAYPFFISVFYFIFGLKPIAVRIAQAVLDSLMCVLIYKLCRRIFDNATALTASLITVFYALFIKAVPHFLTESLFTFCLFFIVFSVYMAKERFTYFNMCLLGAGAAVLALIKGVAIFFLPFLFLILVICGYFYPLPLKEIAKKASVCFMACIIPISIWSYRNFLVYRVFIPISTQGGYAFYDSYFPKDGKIFGVSARDENVRYAISLNSEIKMSKFLKDKTIEFIKQHPLKTARLELLKVCYFWVPFDWEIMGADKGVYNWQYMIILPFSIFGMVLLRRKFNQYAPLYIPVIYFFLMCLVFYGSPRFRLPIETFLIIFGSVGALKFFSAFKNTRIPLIICAVYCALNFVFYLNSLQIKYLLRDWLVSIGLW